MKRICEFSIIGVLVFFSNLYFVEAVDQFTAITIGGSDSEFASSAVQTSDGGYIFGGGTYSYGSGAENAYVVKMTSTGILDTTFGVGGTRTIGGGNNDHVDSIVQTIDGGYIVSGYTGSYGAGNSDWYIVKLTSAGALDTTFGVGGTRTVGSVNNDYALSLIQIADGSYLIAGSMNNTNPGDSDVYIIKLSTTGVFDSSFGVNGKVAIGSSDNDESVKSIVQTADDGYIVSGYTNSYGAGGYDMYIVKLTSAGALDTTFGVGGTRTVGGTQYDYGNSLIKNAYGYIVSGYTNSYGAGGYDMYIVNLDANGGMGDCVHNSGSGGEIGSGGAISSGGTTNPINVNVGGSGGIISSGGERLLQCSVYIDTTPPTLTEVTQVPLLTNDNTPSYTFNTTEAGTITYAGDCTSTTIDAVVGDNTVTFATMSDGAHNNCTITVTDATNNISDSLTVRPFIIDATAPVLTEVTPVPSPTNDNTPSYTFDSSENKFFVSFFGACHAPAAENKTIIVPQGGGNPIYRYDITFGTLSDGTYDDCAFLIQDSFANTSNTLAINTFTIDTAGPTLTQVTPVPSLINDNTPSFTFNTTEAGVIGYQGDCTSATTVAVVGNNQIEFNALEDGLYGNCEISILDALNNLSLSLLINEFIIDTTPPTLTEVTQVPTPANNATPAYTFSSTEVGTITYGGDCSSTTTVASVGNNTVTFNTLSDRGYNNCTIMVTDAANNISDSLTVSPFIIDATAPVLTEVTPVPSPTNDNTPSYTFQSSEDVSGHITYTGACGTPVTEDETEGMPQGGGNPIYRYDITFGTLSDKAYDDCTIVAQDGLGNTSNTLAINAFTIDAVPTLAQVTPVPSPIDDNTPSYTLHATEYVDLTFAGSCGIPQIVGSAVGTPDPNYTITFGELTDGTYDDCTITGEDSTGHMSNILTINTFVIDTKGPTLTMVTSISSPTDDNTPSFIFNTTDAGIITYGGGCSGATAMATIGDNTITLNQLADGKYDNCYITVEDALHNKSTLYLDDFVIDVFDPVITSIKRYEPEEEIVTYDDIGAWFEITFSEPVVNVDKGDFLYSGTAASSIIQMGDDIKITQPSPLVYYVFTPDVFDGTYYLEVHHENNIQDTAGNPIALTVGETERFDFRIPPVIAIEEAVSEATGSITEKFTVIDDSAIMRDKITIDTTVEDSAQVSDLSCVQINSQRVDCTVKILVTGGLVVRATDVAGNEAVEYSDGIYTIGRDIPSGDIEIPKPDLSFSGKMKDLVLSSRKKIQIKNDEIKFKGKYPELAGGKVVIEYKKGSSSSDEETADINQNGDWSKKVKFDKNGSYKITFIYYDKNGKEIGKKGPYNIKIDTEKPKIDDLPGTLNKKVGDKIWWSAKDNEKIDEYKYIFAGKKHKTKNAFFHVPQGTAPGRYALEIFAYDKAGNKDKKQIMIIIR